MENKFTPEQIEKIKNCKTVEEVMAFAEKENVELTDEELGSVAGGNAFLNPTPEHMGISGFGSADSSVNKGKSADSSFNKGK